MRTTASSAPAKEGFERLDTTANTVDDVNFIEIEKIEPTASAPTPIDLEGHRELFLKA